MRVDELVRRLWPGQVARVEQLGGGLTNHNFKVTVGGEDFVVRIKGKDTELLGIDRRSEHGAAVVAAEIGVGPEVVAFVEPEESLVTRFVPGSPIEPDEIRAGETIARVARALRTIHDGPPIPGRFDAFRVVEAYRDTVLANGRPEPANYGHAKTIADRIEAALGPREARPCHNDLLTANFIADGGRIWIVDWEYAGMGDPFFDLGNLSVNNEFDDEADDRLLRSYFGREPGASERAALILMRAMSDVREATWGVVQQSISELEFDFAAYAKEHFERLRATTSEPGFAKALNAAVA